MTKGNKMPRVAIMVAATMVLLLASCQGRTTDNMVPKGQTVDVVISEPATADAPALNDTIAQIDLSKREIRQ